MEVKKKKKRTDCSISKRQQIASLQRLKSAAHSGEMYWRNVLEIRTALFFGSMSWFIVGTGEKRKKSQDGDAVTVPGKVYFSLSELGGPETYFSALCRKREEETLLATEEAGAGGRREAQTAVSAPQSLKPSSRANSSRPSSSFTAPVHSLHQ